MVRINPSTRRPVKAWIKAPFPGRVIVGAGGEDGGVVRHRHVLHGTVDGGGERVVDGVGQQTDGVGLAISAAQRTCADVSAGT